jgi:hypothetical protein
MLSILSESMVMFSLYIREILYLAHICQRMRMVYLTLNWTMMYKNNSWAILGTFLFAVCQTLHTSTDYKLITMKYLIIFGVKRRNSNLQGDIG